MTRPLLYVQSTSAPTGAFFQLPAFQAHGKVIRVHDLDATAIDDARAILVPAHVDQRTLQAHQPALDNFLNTGGTIVLNGHVAWPCLAMLRPFVPLARRGVTDLQVRAARQHPVFAGVARIDLTFRRGVAGFYGRGHNPPPPGAVVLNTIGPDDAPLDWLYTTFGGGRLLMHGGNDLWMYAGDATSAARIAPQLLDWLLDVTR